MSPSWYIASTEPLCSRTLSVSLVMRSLSFTLSSYPAHIARYLMYD